MSSGSCSVVETRACVGGPCDEQCSRWWRTAGCGRGLMPVACGGGGGEKGTWLRSKVPNFNLLGLYNRLGPFEEKFNAYK